MLVWHYVSPATIAVRHVLFLQHARRVTLLSFEYCRVGSAFVTPATTITA